MKNTLFQIRFSKLFFASVVLGLAFAGRPASAQTTTLISPTVNNGGFESITDKSNFTLTTSATAAIPYWGATGVGGDDTTGVGAPDNSGAEKDEEAGATGNNNVNRTGSAGGFWQVAGGSTAFNLVTSHRIVAGNVYTLTWYGRTTGSGGAQVVTLFSQAPDTTTGATYTYQPSATLITVNGLTNSTYALTADNGPFALYTLTYTATAADAGKLIGLTYGSSGTSFIAADDFTLTVASPAP